MRTALVVAALLVAPTATARADRLTTDEVLKKVNTVYITGLQRCYRKSLENDPSLSGKVVLAFRVDAAGGVASELGKKTMLDECLTQMMKRWKFAAAEVESRFRISLVLQNT